MGEDPPQGVSLCDPESFLDPCETFEAKLRCPIRVTRGDTGTCTLEVDPSSALQEVIGWVFNGDNLSVADWQHDNLTWGGQLVESGMVTVHFEADYRVSRRTTRLGVVPRTTGIWTQAEWESQITYDSAGLSVNCVVSRPVLDVEIAVVGSAGTGCVGQQIEPIGAGGYDLDTVPSGPNENAVYVSDAGFYFASASQISPGALPGAPGATLVDSAQAHDCRTALQLPPGPVSVNFWDFNNDCRPVSGWSGFLPALWTHERQHFEQAEAELQQPDNNIYVEVEQVVDETDLGAHSDVTEIYQRIQAAVSQAASVEPTSNWTTNFWIWLDTTLNALVNVINPNF